MSIVFIINNFFLKYRNAFLVPPKKISKNLIIRIVGSGTRKLAPFFNA